MPIAKFQMDDGRVARFEVPEGTTPEQAQQLIESELSRQSATAAPATPQKIGAEAFHDVLRQTVQDASWFDRNAAGFGTALDNLALGLKQGAMGIYDAIRPGSSAEQATGKQSSFTPADRQAIETNRVIEQEAPVGAIAGNVALTAIPFGMVGRSVGGAGGVGAAIGALTPTTDESLVKGKLKNIGGGFVSGAVGQAVGNKAADYVASKAAELATRKAQNAVFDQTTLDSIAAQYKIPPSMMKDSGFISRLLEGISGLEKTKQLARVKNQDVTDSLVRKAMGMASDEALTKEAMQTIRDRAFAFGYKPVEAAGQIQTGAAYAKALDDIVANYQGASRSFPGAVKNEVQQFVDSLRVPSFDAGDALKMTQILRDEAGAAYAAGDKALGKAKRQAASAIEDQIERRLSAAGQDGAELLKNFRAARVTMAKSHDVADAIREGGGTINAATLGNKLQRGKPLTDELATVGKFANNFKAVAEQPKSGNANPFTVVDAGYSLGFGSFNPLAYALPLGRVAARYGVLSGPAQRAIAQPEYAVPLATRSLSSLLQYTPVGATAFGLPALNK